MSNKNKPLQLCIYELKKNITNLINEADVPICCITPVIKDIYEQCVSLENQEFKRLSEEYNEEVNEHQTSQETT